LQIFFQTDDVLANLLIAVHRGQSEEDCYLRAMLLLEADHHRGIDCALHVRIACGLGQFQGGE
jgi:hypothetical protein